MKPWIGVVACSLCLLAPQASHRGASVLEEPVLYQFKTWRWDGAGGGGNSIPGDPIGHALSIDAVGHVTLTWTPSPEPDVVGYNVYRASNTALPDSKLPPVSWQKLNDVLVSAETYVDDEDFAPAEFVFWYSVTAVNDAGSESSLPAMQGDNITQGAEPCDGTSVPEGCICDLPNLTMTCAPLAPLANAADLEALEIDYGQIIFSGDLTIDDLADGVPDEITTLEALRQTTRIEGYLDIRNNGELGDLRGLNSVTRIDGDLRIRNNNEGSVGVAFDSVLDIIGGDLPEGKGSLESQSVGGYIEILSNSQLGLCQATTLLLTIHPPCSDPLLSTFLTELDPVTYPPPDSPDFDNWDRYCCEGHVISGNNGECTGLIHPLDDSILLDICGVIN